LTRSPGVLKNQTTMLRAAAAAALTLLVLGVDARPRAAADAGDEEGGAPDGGVAPATPRASWVHADGGLLDEATGVSDRVTVPVGGQQEVRLPQKLVYGHCDDPSLIRIDGDGETLVFRGVTPGRTHCGFWFFESPFPARYVEVVVTGEAPRVDAGRVVPFWAR
jgi:hypothetical protein